MIDIDVCNRRGFPSDHSSYTIGVCTSSHKEFVRDLLGLRNSFASGVHDARLHDVEDNQKLITATSGQYISLAANLPRTIKRFMIIEKSRLTQRHKKWLAAAPS